MSVTRTRSPAAAGADRRAIAAARRRVDELCGGLEPDDVPIGDVSAMWADLVAIARVAQGAATRLARRLGEVTDPAALGKRDLAEVIASETGVSTSKARQTLAASEVLKDLPEVDQAVRDGVLSADQTTLVAHGAAADS